MWLFCLWLLLALPAHARSAAVGPAPLPVDLIDGHTIKTHAIHFSDPKYKGRLTGERGLFTAAEYIENYYRQWGIQALDPYDHYRQWFTFSTSRVTDISTMEFIPADGEPVTFVDSVDFKPFPYGSSDPVEGKLAFVGYGISAPELGWDDYEGINVNGRIVFVIRKAPNQRLDEFGEHATFHKKAKTAYEHGAVGMVLVTGPNYANLFEPLDILSHSMHLDGPLRCSFSAYPSCRYGSPEHRAADYFHPALHRRPRQTGQSAARRHGQASCPDRVRPQETDH